MVKGTDCARFRHIIRAYIRPDLGVIEPETVKVIMAWLALPGQIFWY